MLIFILIYLLSYSLFLFFVFGLNLFLVLSPDIWLSFGFEKYIYCSIFPLLIKYSFSDYPRGYTMLPWLIVNLKLGLLISSTRFTNILHFFLIYFIIFSFMPVYYPPTYPTHTQYSFWTIWQDVADVILLYF